MTNVIHLPKRNITDGMIAIAMTICKGKVAAKYKQRKKIIIQYFLRVFKGPFLTYYQRKSITNILN